MVKKATAMVKKTVYKAVQAKHEAQRLNRAKLAAAGIVKRTTTKSFYCQRCDIELHSIKAAHALRHAKTKGHI
jgi:ribosomal protein S26